MGFGSAERATALRVHETTAAPFVMRVDLQDEDGGWHTVYTGGDTTASGGWLVIPLGLTAYRVAKAKVYAQGTSGYSGVAVDAVGLDVVGERYGYNGFNQLLTVEGVDRKLTSFGYDGNGNQVWKRERPGFVTQETSYGYDGDNRLRTVKVPVGAVGAPVEQWGATATASSAFGTGTASWAASQATGAPNVTGCTSSGQAWLASSTTAGQWLEVGYAAPAKAVGVRIHETGTAGTVTKVELVDEGGTAHEVWAGTDGTLCGQWLEVKLPETEYRVAKVKLTTKAQTHVDAVSLVSEPAAGPTATVGYEYDANGLRTRRSDAAGVTSYLLDGLSVAATYDATGTRQAWYTQSPARIDEVLNVSNVQGKYWYQADALGSIYALTTASGAVQARGGYDVFGEPVAQGGTPVGQPFGFTGREHEADSGIVYARARYLSTATGRWDRPDPRMINGSVSLRWNSSTSLTADDIHKYAYVGADPIAGTDPTGLMRLGASWNNPESTWIKSAVQAALDLLRGGSEGEPVRCFIRYWEGNEAENPFLDGSNNVRIEWAAGAERDSTLNGHTSLFSDVIYIDTVFPGARVGNYSETRSVLQFAQTIAHETMHNVYHQLLEGVPEYAGGLLISTSSPFHGRRCCSQIQLSLGQWLSLKVAGRL